MSAASRRRQPEPGTGLAHLTGRFFAAVRARPLSEGERRFVRSLLGAVPSERFFAQPMADQRHGVEAARHVAALRPEDAEVIMAALLHDIGKRHSRLGVLARVAASLMIRARLRLPRRFRDYRDHGPIAAEELTDIGAPSLAVEFARHHHGRRPEGIDIATWEVLVGSDQPAKTGDDLGTGISSIPQ